MNKYEINYSTCALMPLGPKKTRIYEIDREFDIDLPTISIIDNSCKFFGSSYRGRFEGTKNLIGIKYKSPIIIEETNSLICFPTESPRTKTCSWIILNNINDFHKYNEKTIISFKNENKIVFNISYDSFNNQFLRAVFLESSLRKRKLFIEENIK